MATLDDALKALRAADAAGNEEDARRLAEMVKRLEAEQAAAPEQENPPTTLERVASTVGGAVKGAGQFVADTAKSAYNAAVGPEGLPDLPEFDAPAPSFGSFLKSGGILAAMTPEQQRDIIVENFPGTQIEEVEADGKKYYIADYTDPETGEQHRGYVNAPGLSTRDTAGIAAQALAFTPAGKVGKGLGAIGRAAAVGTGTAATSAALDTVAQQAGAEDGIDVGRASVAGLAGAGLELLSPTAAKVWRSLKGGTRYFDDRTGRLTKEGIRQARKAGLTSDDIADLDTHSQRVFGDFVEGGMEPEIGARVAQADAAGIPLSRGQATHAPAQLNAEARMSKGLFGETPKRAMDDLAERQARGVEKTAGKVQQRLAGGEPSGIREAQAGERVMGGVRSAADNLKAKIDDAYSGVRDETFGVSPEAAERLPGIIDDELGDMAFDVVPDLMPAASRAERVLGELVESVANGNGARFETSRRRLGRLLDSANTKGDREAVRRIKRGFDKWMDDAVDQGLFEGNPQTLEMLKEARGLRRKYGTTFEADGSRDAAGKVMEKIVEKAETPEQVVNYIMGQSALGRNKETIGAVRRIKKAVGVDSEAWAAIREMAFLRLSRDKRGNFVGGDKFKQNLDEFLHGDKSLADELFDKSELRMMRRLGDAADLTSPQSAAPAKKAASLEAAFRYTLRRFGQRESFTKGNVLSGTLLNFAARMRLPFIGDSAGSRAAENAVKGLAMPKPKAPGFVGTGTTGAVQGYERRPLEVTVTTPRGP